MSQRCNARSSAGSQTSTAVSYGGKPSSELLAAGGFPRAGNWRWRSLSKGDIRRGFPTSGNFA
ncbi:hypothetical protein [Scytonema sp. PRP1]|uniref:hypothetical protein n=1 Tax=Scytonema sp. PRP1 TaxID=3120513 RepID=UPI00300D8B0C